MTKEEKAIYMKAYRATNIDIQFSGGPEGELLHNNIEVIGNIYENKELLNET